MGLIKRERPHFGGQYAGSMTPPSSANGRGYGKISPPGTATPGCRMPINQICGDSTDSSWCRAQRVISCGVFLGEAVSRSRLTPGLEGFEKQISAFQITAVQRICARKKNGRPRQFEKNSSHHAIRRKIQRKQRNRQVGQRRRRSAIRQKNIKSCSSKLQLLLASLVSPSQNNFQKETGSSPENGGDNKANVGQQVQSADQLSSSVLTAKSHENHGKGTEWLTAACRSNSTRTIRDCGPRSYPPRQGMTTSASSFQSTLYNNSRVRLPGGSPLKAEPELDGAGGSGAKIRLDDAEVDFLLKTLEIAWDREYVDIFHDAYNGLVEHRLFRLQLFDDSLRNASDDELIESGYANPEVFNSLDERGQTFTRIVAHLAYILRNFWLGRVVQIKYVLSLKKCFPALIHSYGWGRNRQFPEEEKRSVFEKNGFRFRRAISDRNGPTKMLQVERVPSVDGSFSPLYFPQTLFITIQGRPLEYDLTFLAAIMHDGEICACFPDDTMRNEKGTVCLDANFRLKYCLYKLSKS